MNAKKIKPMFLDYKKEKEKMKKQIAAVMLAATLLPCNVYASEDVNNSYQIGLLSYELSSDWIESEDPIKMYKEAMTFFNGNASLEISVFEADTDPYMISEDDKNDVIDACFQIFTEGFSEMDEYEKLSSEYLNSSLNTQAYFSSFTFDHKNVKGVGMTYNLYYEKSIYNVIFLAPLNSLSDYTSVLTDFDDSLKPVEIISDAATVQKVQEALNQKGYNCGTPDGIAGANTESAVKSYQKDFNLLETGKITNKLLESLSIQSEEADNYVDAGLPNSEIQTEVQTESPVETPIGTTVWISNTGSKYHSRSSCSNMKNPSQVTLEDAQAMGYTPCKKCH